jgi:hypothetical protein
MPVTINGTTGVVSPDGSAGTPAYQGSDANTGMFFPAADTIAFAEGGTEVMRIDSSGNVGIGTSSPSYRLDVVASGGTTISGVYDTNSGGNSQAIARLRTAGTGAGYWDIGTGNNSSGLNGALRFFDNIAAAERARIDSSGNLLVGTTSVYDNSRFTLETSSAQPNGIAVKTNGNNNALAFWRNSTTYAGAITLSGSGTAYTSASDYRLKEDVQPMTGALAKVQALKPVIYKWKLDGSDGQGFIAHELQALVPDCVTGEKDAVDADGNPVYQGIDTSFLVATLTAAIQEQQALITSLTARIAALEGAAQ